jgi:hypothetical protein
MEQKNEIFYHDKTTDFVMVNSGKTTLDSKRRAV